ncbi:permease component of ABC-type sugar transporter [Opitutaceae bacterium TAV1]|nr:permease component of ABC-type sugar transporter [Opitutaceae bacterium TAV1]
MVRLVAVVICVCGALAWSSMVARADAATRTEDVVLDVPVLVAGYGAAFFEQVAREFEALRPGMRVRLHGDPRISDKVRIRVMAGDYPDATDAVLLYPNLIAAGRILDLAPYLDGPNWEGDARWRDTFLPGVLGRWTVQASSSVRGSEFGVQGSGSGNTASGDAASPSETLDSKPQTLNSSSVYGLPFAHAVWTLFYNKQLFREHGWEPARTWDEFFVLCEKIEAAGIAPVALPGVFMRYGDAFLRAAHYNLVGPDGYRAYLELAPGARSDPRFVRAAGVLQRVSTRYLVRGWEGMSHTAAQLEFIEGRAAMAVSASWFVNEMRGRLPEGFGLGVMNFPVFAETERGAGVPPAPQSGADTLQAQSGYYFLFKTGDPERERAAVDFFRYLTSREVARRFARQIDSPVALRAVRAEDYSPWMRDTAVLIEHAAASAAGSFDAAPATSAAFQALMNQALTDARYRLMTGRITPEEFGERLEAAAATERARLADPDRVEVRHGWAAAGLLLVVAGLAGWIGWGGGGPKRWQRQRGRKSGAAAFLPLRRRKASPDSGNLNGMAHSQDASTKGEARGASSQRQECRRSGMSAPPGFLGHLRLRFAAGFVGPAFLLFAAFVLAPGVVSLAWALTRWDGFGERSWAGLFNFRWLLVESDVFWFALRNNLYLMLVPALVVVPAALFFAVLIHRGVWGARVFRVVFLFPNLLGGVAATLLWMAAYDPRGGIVNAGLVACGRWLAAAGAPDALAGWFLGFEGFAWLAQGHLYGALIPIYLWMACGFNLVLYLAAMESIPAELYEAAEIDGASPARQFFSVTLPLIREVLVISAVFLVIGGLNAFELVWLLTSQDPASGSHTLGTLMVSTMFQEFQIGRATAIAVVMFVLVLVGSAAVMRAMRENAES